MTQIQFLSADENPYIIWTLYVYLVMIV